MCIRDSSSAILGEIQIKSPAYPDDMDLNFSVDSLLDIDYMSSDLDINWSEQEVEPVIISECLSVSENDSPGQQMDCSAEFCSSSTEHSDRSVTAYNFDNVSNNKNTFQAGMARLFYTLHRANSSETDCKLGPMLDDGAPYSAIGKVELNLLTHNPSILDPLPK